MWFKSYLYYTLSKKLMADLTLVKAGFIDFKYIPVVPFENLFQK